MGVSEQTFYRWKKLYAGLGVCERRRLKLLEEENRKLKQLVAETSASTSIFCRTCCQKKSDACAAARARRVRPGVPRCQPAA